MAYFKIYLFVSLIFLTNADEDLRDFEFSEPHELLIAQESRNYDTVVAPPVRILKPNGITNSHRPQYNLDSTEDFLLGTTKRPLIKNYKIKKDKEGMIRDAVLKALEKKDHVGKFAQILPIIRAMSGNQRVALASLVASQVTTPPGRQPLSFSQVRSMFNNDTADLMLPILLDTANLIRRSMRPGKEQREVRLPQTMMQRRSYNSHDASDEDFDTGTQESTTVQSIIQKYRDLRSRSQRVPYVKLNTTKTSDKQILNKTVSTIHVNDILEDTNLNSDNNRNLTRSTYSTTEPTKRKFEITDRVLDNTTLDLTVDDTNTTMVQDMPVAEKLRSMNRYVDRKGNLIRRGIYPKPSTVTKRTIEPAISLIRRRPTPAKTLTANEQAKCELFTNNLCLHSDDYPTDAIVQSIRRNKAAAGALLADFKDPGEGSIDGITAEQEEKYTADHYLVSNRRGDTSNRDFASAGEAGFMCPSTVKYARPQRARATSGQWKYIVNTGEHTQTLRLEKCLKPKESCTYLTDNFKSKCVQVYNYHRLLTWDQQNGLHMDIFKVPTCCSCHIEGYSVSFPPLGHRVHETSSEHFPGEDLSSEHLNQAFESKVQSSIQRPNVKHPTFVHKLEFPFTDNSIPNFNKAKLNDDDFNNLPPMDSYGNTYFPDSFNQASSIRNIKRPLRNPIGVAVDSITLPSYLEPPSPSPSFTSKDSLKYKIDHYNRRPNRRPIRNKISSGPEDLLSSGTSAIGAILNENTNENFEEELDESEININKFNPRATIAPKLHAVTDKHLEQGIAMDEAVKKINYNYHPIIDFFNDKSDNSDSIDREDTAETYATTDSEWKPISSPSDKKTNSILRKKH